MPHHHMQHAQNMGPNLFVRNENSAYVMSRVTARAVTSCMHCMVHALHGACMLASQPPLCIHGAPEITYGHAIHASQTIFIKINCLTSWHPKY